MSIRQLTVFVENRQGALAEITKMLASKGIDLRALSMADTNEFGVLRLIVRDVEQGLAALRDNGMIVNVTPVTAIRIPDKAGNLASALAVLADAGLNVEYLYAIFTHSPSDAYIVLRVADNETAQALLKDAGVHVVEEDELLAL